MDQDQTWRVVSFFTTGTPYEEEVKHLTSSLDNLNIPHTVYPIKNKGDWVKNCGMKPIVIHEALRTHKENIVFLDADAVVLSYPSFFDNCDADFSCHITESGTLLSGTLFFKNNLASKRLVRLWVWEQLQNAEKWDQVNLQTVFNRFKPKYKSLPFELVKIFDKPGKPIIVHNQASRRYKHMLNDSYPKQVGGCRTRLHDDGTFSVVRIRKEDADLLDKTYGRVKGENRWLVKIDSDINDIRHYFYNHVYIVGKGPTLDHVEASDFSLDSPILCLNDSVHKIASLRLKNKLFTIQQDSGLGDSCINDKSTLLLSRYAVGKYKPDYMYTPELLGLRRNSLSVNVAIALAKDFGVTEYTLVAFDASTNKKIAYADCIGYTPDKAGDPKRFLTHRVLILKALEGHKVDWVTKDVPDFEASYDTPEKLQDNLEEHHEPSEQVYSDDPPHIPDSASRTEPSPPSSTPDH